MVPAFAGLLSALLLLAAIASPIALYFTLGPPPCQDEGWVYDVARLAVPIALVAGSVLLHRQRRRPDLTWFVIALVLPASAIELYALAARAEADHQSECSKRSLEAAMSHCRANPDHYRMGWDHNGYRTLTLIAPGSTDQTWHCLWTWNTHNGSVSLKIDESIYEHYRRTHPRR